MWIRSGLGVGERSRRRLRGDVERDRLFSLFLSLSTFFSPSSFVFSSSGLLSTFGLSLAGALFFWCFFNEALEREEPDESEELDELDDDLESEEELLDDRELELLLLLLLDDLELLLEELSLLDALPFFFPESLVSFLSLLASFDLLESSPAFRSFRSPVSLSGIFRKFY